MKIKTEKTELLKKYAHLLINFSLNYGKGINKGDVVILRVPIDAAEMMEPLMEAVMKAGGIPIPHTTYPSLQIYAHATDEQLRYCPEYLAVRYLEIDHYLRIATSSLPTDLTQAQSKIVREAMNHPFSILTDRIRDKEISGTVALFPTKHGADLARMSQKEYWNQICQGCFLYDTDPVSTWKKKFKQLHALRDELNTRKFRSLRVVAQETEISFKLHERSQWVAGTGSNMPSVEVFTNVIKDSVNGHVSFSEPCLYKGTLITGIQLTLKNGKVVDSSAKSNKHLLEEMLNLDEGMRYFSEFSLTDARMSGIVKFMAATLYDENRGGKYGNMHFALGSFYKKCFIFDSEPTQEELIELGCNFSDDHRDLISTTNRKVIDLDSNEIIYDEGKFTFWK